MRKNWARAIRCRRVTLRKQYGSKFTEKEFKKAIKKKVSYKDDGIYEEDIPQALLSGDEWTVKCKGYDADSQRNLADKYSTWVPPPPPKSKKGQGQGEGKGTAVTGRRESGLDDKWRG
ncbi:hypothetical protein H2248_005768 [Termitomyces sp. 'cryptogamus']|nr:hypothetical protein H2248_005768 [Termitomyces sp. 'cryptogamus']